jgi:hypothetical protein
LWGRQLEGLQLMRMSLGRRTGAIYGGLCVR